MIPPKFNRVLGRGEAEVPVTDSTSNIYNNGMCPAYNIDILEDVGHAFAASILDIIDDNPVSRLPLSRFKTTDAVRNEVSNTVNKTGGKNNRVSNYVVSKENKPPLKVRVKNKTAVRLRKAQSRSIINKKPELKKAVSMPVKQKGRFWKGVFSKNGHD